MGRTQKHDLYINKLGVEGGPMCNAYIKGRHDKENLPGCKRKFSMITMYASKI